MACVSQHSLAHIAASVQRGWMGKLQKLQMTVGTANSMCMQVEFAGEWVVSWNCAASATCNAWLCSTHLMTLTCTHVMYSSNSHIETWKPGHPSSLKCPLTMQWQRHVQGLRHACPACQPDRQLHALKLSWLLTTISHLQYRATHGFSQTLYCNSDKGLAHNASGE